MTVLRYSELRIHDNLLNRKSKTQNDKLKYQGDHGRRRANYRCCLPALAGFVSPHSMGPGMGNLPQRVRGFKNKAGASLDFAEGVLQTAAPFMEIRYSPNQQDYQKLGTEQLRATFLADGLFAPGKIELLYSDADRAIVGAAVPGKSALKLVADAELRSAFFCAYPR